MLALRQQQSFRTTRTVAGTGRLRVDAAAAAIVAAQKDAECQSNGVGERHKANKHPHQATSHVIEVERAMMQNEQ